ncbi:MAG: hypothetical protein ACXVXO_00685 [Mycobacteriaceae bacterium]
MRLDDDAKTYLWWRSGELTADPTGSTVALEVDGTQRAMVWDVPAVQSGTKWIVTARTTMKFAGSAATVSGTDVALTPGRHIAQPIVTTADGQVVAGPEFPIDVK